jgi:GNAT superfamily N-acetyltransferase
MINIRQLDKSDIGRIADIDRSEHVTVGYVIREGELIAEEVDWQVPQWSTDDHPEWSVQARIEAWAPYLEQGGTMFGAFDGDVMVGVTMYQPKLTEDMAQLAILFVSNGYRRRGIAARLAAEVEQLAREDGSKRLYVSATPSQSAVGFYQSQGFEVVEKPHPELYALEPEDIHMSKTLKEKTSGDSRKPGHRPI